MAIFDSKTWNDAVFQKYMKKVPNLKENSLVKNGILLPNQSLKSRLVDGVGGNTLIEPIKGLLDGDYVNYDGMTDITSTPRGTFNQKKIVIGRAKGWVEKDFSTDLTGEKWLDGVAQEVAEYYQGVDQETILAILKGIFSMNSTAGTSFVASHTTDISEAGSGSDVISATTANSAAQKALGDKKKNLTLAFMHSVIATNLENLKLLEYLKYTDSNGIEQDLGMATWNGKLVIIDDEMPVDYDLATAGVYTLKINTAALATDTVDIFGVTYTCVASGATGNQFNVGSSASDQATSIKNLLAAATTGTAAKYTYTVATDTITMTMKKGLNFVDEPTAVKGTGDTIVVTLTTTTSPVYVNQYTTYLLGKGAFEYCDIGASVPSETYRTPDKNGGQDYLFTRQRKLFAPAYITWAGSESIVSPTKAQLEAAGNWDIVNDGAESKTYVDGKLLPFVRIISRG